MPSTLQQTHNWLLRSILLSDRLFTLEPEKAEEEIQTYVATRRLLIGDVVYPKGASVTAEMVGKHLPMLLSSGQLVPTGSPNPRERRRTLLQRMFRQDRK